MEQMNKPELTQAAIEFFRKKGFPPHDHEQQQAESYAEFFIKQSKPLHDRIRELEEVTTGFLNLIEILSEEGIKFYSGDRKIINKAKKLINPK